jgi:hypothetical protein
MENEKRLTKYYVVRNKSTGFYFRGKGANRWGEYHNQASIYRIRAHAENTANWLNLRGEPVEIVPIKIVENPTVEAVEVKRGRWLPDMEEFDDDPAVGIRGGVFQTGWKCSICGRSEPVKEPYCNCGADMR